MDTLEGNKLIAEFMGGKYRKSNTEIGERFYNLKDKGFYYLIPELKYHSSWDWLMPVVEKIGQYKFEDFEYAFMRTLHSNMARIHRFSVHEGGTQIEATFKAVIEFIEWYNHQPVTNKN